MHPGANLDKSSDAAADPDPSRRRIRDARRQLQGGRLAGAVRANDRERLPLGNLEADAVERPDDVPARSLTSDDAAERRHDVVSKRTVLMGSTVVL
jgi:hypothetical protein